MKSHKTSFPEFEKLVDLIDELRNPQKGCAWDIEQTHSSLIPYVLEEAYEVADAIRHGDDQHLKEELGDLLLQILLHSQIAKEEGRFNLEEIAQATKQKIIRRHPHVFKNKIAMDSKTVHENWESIKDSERQIKSSKTPLSDKLREKVRSQPALAAAMALSKQAALAGFEWKSLEGVWEKVYEEINELQEAIARQDRVDAQKELGDVLFALVNIGRWCQLNPEEGLSGTNNRFINRLNLIEVAMEGKISEHSLSEIQQEWEIAKFKLNQKT